MVVGIPVNVNSDSSERPHGVLAKANSRRSEATLAYSLAVLPLENLSGDPAQEYFADGMTDELTTMLGQKFGSMRNFLRTSVMQYKKVHRPLPDIARELGVDGILEGSVGRTAKLVHVNVQLIFAPTDTHPLGRQLRPRFE